MAALITPSLRSALERLRNGGAVNGILLGWRRQTLINLLPFEDHRAERLLDAVRAAQEHFSSGGDRQVQTFWFGYDTAHILVAYYRECVLVLLHTRAEEGDFLRRAIQTFLEDTQLLVDSVLNPTPDDGGETQRLGEDGDLEHANSGPTTNFIGRVA